TNWAGPYDAYVTGESWNGVLTTTSPAAQYLFEVKSPLITTLQGDITNLTAENSLLQARLLSLNQSLSGEISSANNRISTLTTNLALDNATISSQHKKIVSLESQALVAEALAIVGLIGFIIAIVALAIALTRKPKQ
ncbi:MAG: hypothetical protein QW302_03575, partial [Thermoplasmatales archaeon]